VGKKEGDNPHFWYNPAYVTQVADKITSTLKSIDAPDAGYFDQIDADADRGHARQNPSRAASHAGAGT